jgi:hypothetical protein
MSSRTLLVVSLMLTSCSFPDAWRAQKHAAAQAQIDVASLGAIASKGEQPAEQRFKNIRVLRGLPASQLYPVMSLMSNSLGVTCAHCHTEFFEEESRDEKQAAREMILLTRTINRMQFQGEPTVTCYTCHRGAEYPATMPDVTQAGWQKMLATKAPAPPLPEVDAVLTRYEQAIAAGGLPHGSGEVSIVGGLDERASGHFELGADGKLKTTVHVPPPVEQALAASRFGALDVKAYDHVRVFRRDQGAIVLAATSDENAPDRLYFDESSGLLQRVQHSVKTELGYTPEEIRFSDYRDVAGVPTPHTVEWARGDFLVTLRFSELAR